MLQGTRILRGSHAKSGRIHVATADPLPASRLKDQAPIFVISLGHGATHWIGGTFYILLPALTKDLGLSYTAAGLLVSVLHISAFVANFGSGVVVDMTGRKVVFQVASLAVGGGALALFGVTGAYFVLAALVMLIGVTNNLWHPPAIAFIADRYPERRGYALALHATGASIGDMIAPLAAGALLVSFSWQGTAAISALPVLVISLLFALYLMPQDRPAPGAAKRGMGLRDYRDGLLRLVRRRAVLGLCMMAALRSMAQTGLLMFLPLFLSDVLGVSPLAMGTAVMGMHIGGVIVSPIAGALSDRVGPRPVVIAGLAATTVLIVGLTFVDNLTVFVAAVSVLGFVLYAVRPVIHSWMMDLAPADLRGSATSLLFGTQSALSILIPVLGGAVADHFGLTQVFYLIAGIMLLANMAVVFLPRPERTA
jgi:MFS family permease